MKIKTAFHRRFRWVNLPTATLLALLQRTPIAQVVQVADEMVSASPIGAILRSSAAAAAALGALNSLAGATTLVSSPLTSPINATKGTAISTTAITVSGTQSEPGSWTIGAGTPPGLAFTNSNGASPNGSGNLDVPNGVLFLSGTPTAAGTYNVPLTAFEFAGEGGVQSPTYTYTIVVAASSTAPSFTTSPATQTVNVGQSVTFTAAASGSPTPTYQWQKGTTAIGGATSSSYTIASPALSDAGSYSVIATNSAGTTTSAAATLTVISTAAAPVFTAQPLSQPNVSQGVTVNFNGTAVGGTVTYQWEFGSGTLVPNGLGSDGNTYSGATTSSLVVVAQTGALYKLVATNGNGSTTSTTATLTVMSAGTSPLFTTQPLTQTVNVGATVTFTAAATNAVSYQWTFNGNPISNATNPSYTIPHGAQTSDAGSYAVVASGAGSMDIYGDPIPGPTTTSSTATLTVLTAAAPAFTTQPASQTVNVGSTATFTAAASGSPTYQWTFNGANITGNSSATTAALTLTNVQLSAIGSYAVVATNAGGPVTSQSASLNVINVAAPAFTLAASPSTASVATGRSFVLNVIATGTPAPTLQWTLNGSPTIPGATVTTDPILVVAGATSADSGTYTCTATNSIGSPATTSATVTVAASSNPGYLNNLSGRGVVGLGLGNGLFAGFGISGTGSKQLLIRGIGPGLLVPYPTFVGYLPDPYLTLYDNTPAVIATNDNWGGGSTLVNAQLAVGAYALPSNSLDAMLYFPEPASSYSAEVSGNNSTTGISVVELYDADTASPPPAKLINVSVRAPVGTGGNILFGGFTIGGATSETVLIRAIGPGFPPSFGLGGVALQQPVLALFAGITPIYSNTVWGGDPALVTAMAEVGAYPLAANTQDSLLLVTLPPGGYSAEISGVNNTTGVAAVEIYEIQ